MGNVISCQSNTNTKYEKTDFFFVFNTSKQCHVESVFSEMKHLFSDCRNRMSVDSITAELQIRRNTSLSCTDMHKHLLSQKELLAAISSNNKYTFKRQRVK